MSKRRILSSCYWKMLLPKRMDCKRNFIHDILKIFGQQLQLRILTFCSFCSRNQWKACFLGKPLLSLIFFVVRVFATLGFACLFFIRNVGKRKWLNLNFWNFSSVLILLFCFQPFENLFLFYFVCNFKRTKPKLSSLFSFLCL
jgi:hypothetical protein